MNAVNAICDFATNPPALPVQARADAERLLADTLAGGAAGAQSPEAQKLRQALGVWGDNSDARLLDGSGYAPAPSAAFFNGFAIHCLEWDAVHEGAVVHALSTVTAALLAVSDRKGGSEPDDFLKALAIGVDIASGIGLSATGPMHFFRPATAGVFGAALGCAWLDGLPREKFPDVMGLAYSFASGTMQAHVEASIALPLQIANAARAAVTALDLAKAGMNGPHDVLDGPFGYSKLIEPLDLGRYTDDLGQVWRIAEISIKPFPSGRASHGALGALQAVRSEHGIGLSDVRSIKHYAPPLIKRLVGRPYQADMSAAYARLCLPILAPLMLRDGVIDPALFEDSSLHDPALVTLAEHVSVELDGKEDGNAMVPQRIVVDLANDETIEREIPATLGSPAAPMNAEQSAQKYDLCHRLAGTAVDSRIFDKPLVFATDPA
ncbi:MmgE/PrpD family protein [Altererythrobacter sp. MF3-039]|uniref:MmgE/PrpD family protein n=1 Tax=Altererythrobacter sp. MF3-039 TaxID=3252901 RepID=UPI00390CC453